MLVGVPTGVGGRDEGREGGLEGGREGGRMGLAVDGLETLGLILPPPGLNVGFGDGGCEKAKSSIPPRS